MKNILRTKLVYNCEKREDFDYVEREWKIVYDRSFDMYVSASTKEDCEKAMESFEDAIRAEGIQECFDSNLTPEYDEKKKLWVGAVEVYVGNDYVTEEKELIKEVYKDWKILSKANPFIIENPAPAPAPATVEEKATEDLIFTISTLSAGTISTLAKDAGIVEKDSTVTYDDVEKIVCDWLEFVETNKSTHKKWQDSWVEYLSSKKPTTIDGHKSQEERVEEMIGRLELEKEYKVDDGAGTKITIVKKENGVWWGGAHIWNMFNSITLDYQEYILKLIFKNIKGHICEFEFEDSEIDTETYYDHDKIIKTTYYRCKNCGKLKREVAEEKKYYNESDWR